ncbi:hypothetical protein, partial [Escherichia coli]
AKKKRILEIRKSSRWL